MWWRQVSIQDTDDCCSLPFQIWMSSSTFYTIKEKSIDYTTKCLPWGNTDALSCILCRFTFAYIKDLTTSNRSPSDKADHSSSAWLSPFTANTIGANTSVGLILTGNCEFGKLYDNCRNEGIQGLKFTYKWVLGTVKVWTVIIDRRLRGEGPIPARREVSYWKLWGDCGKHS